MHESRTPRRIALIGFGALGRVLAGELQAGHLPDVEFIGALVRDTRAQPGPHRSWTRLADLLAAGPDLVVEVAGQAALEDHVPDCLRSGCDVVAASVGALMESALFARLRDCAHQGGSRLLIPSGALGGLDYLRAARRVGPVEVSYRGSKPVSAWRGTAAEALIDLRTIDVSTVFFCGNAREAALRFPQNANVVAALALAVGDPLAVNVTLVADPDSDANRHEFTARGDAGTIRFSVENSPLPSNPKSSRVTAFSILETVASHWGET